MAKGCALSTGYLPRGGLPRNSVDRITDRPDMTSAVDRGRKSINPNKQTKLDSLPTLALALLQNCLKYYFLASLLSNLVSLGTMRQCMKGQGKYVLVYKKVWRGTW